MSVAGGQAPALEWFNEWLNGNHPRLSAAVALTEKHPVIAGGLESNFGK